MIYHRIIGQIRQDLPFFWPSPKPYSMKNIYADIPTKLPSELFQTILEAKNIKIERIISLGHTTPTNKWYDQDQDEWVLVIQGKAKIRLENGDIKALDTGDYLWIPAHQKHQVIWTPKNQKTIWLAIHF